MADQKPSVGRIVHYLSRGSADGAFEPECRAAIVTQVHEPDPDYPNSEFVGLAVLNPSGLFFDETVIDDPRDESERVGGTWHWPERV